MRNIVVQVASSQNDKYVEVSALHQVEYVFLVYHALLYAWLQVVVDELGGYTRDRLLARWIDIAEDDFVEKTQAVGKVLVEVTGAGVEMWLEDSGNLAVFVQLTDALRTLVNLFWVMSVVGKEYELVVLDLEVEAAVHASVCLHSVAQLIGCTAIQLGHCHCCHTVGDVDRHWLAEFHACYVLDRRDEVECDSAILYLDVLSMEVAFVLAVFVYLDTVLHVLLHLQVFVDDEGTARLNQFCVVAEAFQICFLGAVDVEVVWVGRCDDAHP